MKNKTAQPALARPSTWKSWALPGASAVIGIGLLAAGGVAWSIHQAGLAAEQAAIARLDAAAHALGTAAGVREEDAAPLIEALATGTHPVLIERRPAGPNQQPLGPGMVQIVRPIPGTTEAFVLATRPDRPGLVSAAALPASAAVITLLIVAGAMHRTVRTTGGLRRVGSALNAIAAGETDPGMLRIADRFGPYALAWNDLLVRMNDAHQGATGVLQDRRDAGLQSGHLPAGALDAMPVGLLALDGHERILFCNGAAAAMLNIQRSEAVGVEAAGLPALEGLHVAIAAAARGLRPRDVLELTREGGGGRDVIRVTVKALRKNDEATVMVMLEDVTQQRLAEEARNSFVTQATHELRAPLTNIRLSAEEAIDIGRDDPAEMANALNIVNKEARRLERVVNDMLSVSEIEAASMSLNIDDVPLAKLIAELEDDYAAQATDAGVDLRFTLPAKIEPIRADRDKLALALHNVLGNAIKYTPRGGSVELSIAQEPGDVLIAVRDTGPGIAPADHEKIFQKFYRTDSARGSEVKGSGLGLALAREVARLHGGDVTLESDVGRGSTFTVRVPRGAISETVSRAA